MPCFFLPVRLALLFLPVRLALLFPLCALTCFFLPVRKACKKAESSFAFRSIVYFAHSYFITV